MEVGMRNKRKRGIRGMRTEKKQKWENKDCERDEKRRK